MARSLVARAMNHSPLLGHTGRWPGCGSKRPFLCASFWRGGVFAVISASLQWSPAAVDAAAAGGSLRPTSSSSSSDRCVIGRSNLFLHHVSARGAVYALRCILRRAADPCACMVGQADACALCGASCCPGIATRGEFLALQAHAPCCHMRAACQRQVPAELRYSVMSMSDFP